MFDVSTDIREKARGIMSVFQNEARINRTALQLDLSPSFDDLGLETIMTDPVRLGQVYVPARMDADKQCDKLAVECDAVHGQLDRAAGAAIHGHWRRASTGRCVPQARAEHAAPASR